MKKNLKNHPGFTLVELLVVMAIIAVLSGIGIISFMSSQQKARDAKRKADLRNLSGALEAFYNDHGQYPRDVDGLIGGCGDSSTISTSPTGCAWGNPFKLSDKDTYYVTQLPKDPNHKKYYYESSDGTYYVLYARLENNKDKDIPKNPDTGALQVYKRTDTEVDTDCGGIVCNFAKSSSNLSATDLKTKDE